MVASTDKIKQLREETGAGVMECKRALEQSAGDFPKAKELLKKKGLEIAAKKASRSALEGRIVGYIHHNHKVGALVEINCETDFVAKNEDFNKLCKDIAMQIVATSTLYLKKEDVPQQNVPEHNAHDFFKKNCLIEQAFIKDESITIGEYVTSMIAKTGENIIVKKFVRFELGKEI